MLPEEWFQGKSDLAKRLRAIPEPDRSRIAQEGIDVWNRVYDEQFPPDGYDADASEEEKDAAGDKGRAAYWQTVAKVVTAYEASHGN